MRWIEQQRRQQNVNMIKSDKNKSIINKDESTTVEWKQSLSEMDELIETAVAFANTEGGRIFMGISPGGKVAGVQIGKGTIEKIVNHIRQHTDPKLHPRVTVKHLDRKEVIVVEIKESHDHLVLAFGRPYKRVGRSTVKMTKDEYEHLIFEKHHDKLHFDTMVCKNASLQDIDPAKVRWFLEKAKEEGRLNTPGKVSVKDALQYLKVFHHSKLNNTAILLFAKDPQKFFVQSKIYAGRIKGTEGHDFLDTKVLEGTIPELRGGALRFIAEHIKKAVFFDANQRYDKWEYPLRALEEALNNALAHRDYWANGDIQLAIYDNRIEIWNPGELPKQLTPKQLKEKHRSIPRNQFLADKLYLIKYIERWGRGTNRIVEEMRKEKLPDPVFANNSGGFEIALPGPGRSFEKAIEDTKLHKLDLNERQKKVMSYLRSHGEISRKKYAELSRVSLRQANKDLGDLLKKKVIVQVGMGRSTKYQVHD
ncbi:MAG: putative DNA binding domain-containing protein [Candidatus Omnitrophica bacterium]|nr:putative DNA binding domain-containing protein [Candidatus Omnitrophota bacterium]